MVRNTKHCFGFSILEVLIASLIIGISIFAIMEAFNRGFFAAGEVEDYSIALSLAQEKLEEFMLKVILLCLHLAGCMRLPVLICLCFRQFYTNTFYLFK